MIRKLKSLWRKIRNRNKQRKLNNQLNKFDRKPNVKKEFSEIKSICFLRWDNKLGDTIISSALVSCLSRYRPDLKITVITGEISASWLKNIDDVDIIECPKRSIETAKSFIQYKGKFDAVIELGSSFGEKELRALSALEASYYIGYDKEKYNLFNVNVDIKYQNMMLRYKAVASMFIPEYDFEYHLPTPDFKSALQKFLPLIEPIKLKGNIVVAMNFFGSGKYRKFSFSEAKLLTERWLKENKMDYMLFIPVPEQSKFLKRLKEQSSFSERIIYVDHPPSIKNTLALLSLSDFCFTPDTSVVHMASAVNKPVLAIYGGKLKNYEEWKPIEESSHVIFNPMPKTSSDRVSVSNFNWQELSVARSNLLISITRKRGLHV
jgi:ADP-heptose:LPS heptosyltransferase